MLQAKSWRSLASLQPSLCLYDCKIRQEHFYWARECKAHTSLTDVKISTSINLPSSYQHFRASERNEDSIEKRGIFRMYTCLSKSHILSYPFSYYCDEMKWHRSHQTNIKFAIQWFSDCELWKIRSVKWINMLKQTNIIYIHNDTTSRDL